MTIYLYGHCTIAGSTTLTILWTVQYLYCHNDNINMDSTVHIYSRLLSESNIYCQYNSTLSLYDNIYMDSTIAGSMNDNMNMDSIIAGSINDNINMESTIAG